MKARSRRVVVYLALAPLLVLCSVTALPQNAAPPMDSDDSYAVYAAVLQNAWQLRVAKVQSILIVQQTTDHALPNKSTCLDDWNKTVTPWDSVVADYIHHNQTVWTLEPKFSIRQQYKLLPREELDRIFQKVRWWPETARERIDNVSAAFQALDSVLPGSKGYIELSAVGFDAERTRAMVYMQTSCGWQCTEGRLWYFEKHDGKWVSTGAKRLPSCSWAS